MRKCDTSTARCGRILLQILEFLQDPLWSHRETWFQRPDRFRSDSSQQKQHKEPNTTTHMQKQIHRFEGRKRDARKSYRIKFGSSSSVVVFPRGGCLGERKRKWRREWGFCAVVTFIKAWCGAGECL